MTIKEIIKAVEEKTELTGNEVRRVLDAYHDVIVDTVVSEGKLTFPKFGTFKMTTRSAREGINPRTREMIQIKESKSISFKPSSVVKDRL